MYCYKKMTWKHCQEKKRNLIEFVDFVWHEGYSFLTSKFIHFQNVQKAAKKNMIIHSQVMKCIHNGMYL